MSCNSIKDNIPNLITLFRISGTVALLFTEPFSRSFFVIYILCGISDVLDGFFARLFNVMSDFGAKMDSFADIFFYVIMAIKIFPVMFDNLWKGIWILVILIVLVRIAAYVVAGIRYKNFVPLHTKMNKLTGFTIFLLPFVIRQSFATAYCLIVAFISGYASVEELIIHLKK